MAQILTDIKSNLIFSDEKSKVTEEALNNGDIAFCAEDKSITLKYNDSLYNMGGTEITDASDTVKGITKLSDAVDSDDSTVAATSKAVKTTYDEATSAKTKANEAYTMGESLITRFNILENAISYKGDVIGITRTTEYNGGVAEWVYIDNNFNEISFVNKNYFNNHPSFQFTETMFGNDVMIKIPLCYWWRGTIPSGPYKGHWGMMLSPTANPGISGITFKPNYVAFMNKGTLMDCFYISKYKVRNINDIPVSQYEGDIYTSILFDDAKTLCANKGTNYHMGTIQEYHDIIARAAIEKCSFDDIIAHDYWELNKGGYYIRKECNYRGIDELCGINKGTDDLFFLNSGKSIHEYMDGLQIINERCQVFDNNGNRTWVNSNYVSSIIISGFYITKWISNQYFDNMFIGDNDSRESFATNVLTLDTQGINWSPIVESNDAVIETDFSGIDAGSTYKNYPDSSYYSSVGFRLAKF